MGVAVARSGGSGHDVSGPPTVFRAASQVPTRSSARAIQSRHSCNVLIIPTRLSFPQTSTWWTQLRSLLGAVRSTRAQRSAADALSSSAITSMAVQDCS